MSVINFIQESTADVTPFSFLILCCQIVLEPTSPFTGALPLVRVEPHRIKAKILVCHGADDSFVSGEQIQQFQENLKYAGADWQFIVYGGAKHSFTNPGADRRGIAGLGYNRAADERSWNAMLTFFKEIFSEID